MPQYQRGQKFILETEGMVPGGVAIGHLPDGRPVFIKDAAPNEQLEISLRRIKKDFAEGTIENILSPSPNRVTPDFPVAALVGANWAYLDYPTQLAAKMQTVDDNLVRIGHLSLQRLLAIRKPIVPSPNFWRYRNKVELTFGVDKEGKVALGFHVPGRFDQILPTGDIALFSEISREIIRSIVDWAHREKLAAYDPRRKIGLLRHLVIRRAEHGSDLVLNLVTSPGSISQDSLLLALDSLPVSGLVWSQNASLATIVRVDQMKVLAGTSRITETFLSQKITYEVDSFFQTHTSMAEKLAETLLTCLQPLLLPKPYIQHRELDLSGLTIIDGYAGVGGFGLLAAIQGAKVISIESHPASSRDARQNAEQLGVAHRMQFINEPMEHYFQSHTSSFFMHNSVLIVDPPRAGLHPKAVQAILASDIQHVFYVSCNPATLARDLSLLSSHSSPFTPQFIQPFDFFPQTSHLETLVEFVRS